MICKIDTLSMIFVDGVLPLDMYYVDHWCCVMLLCGVESLDCLREIFHVLAECFIEINSLEGANLVILFADFIKCVGLHKYDNSFGDD